VKSLCIKELAPARSPGAVAAIFGEYYHHGRSLWNGQRSLTSQEKSCRFEEQISPHLKSAYNLAKWLTRSHEDAEDIVQEAFLRAFSAFESFRGENAKSWLLTIVRNTSMTWLKRNRNAGATIGFEEALEDPIERSPDPEEGLLISCDREQVRQALEQLPSDFREAVILREMEGLSYKEISATIGVPIGTVMSRLSRGRDWLRRILLTPQPVKPEEGAGLR
jgi:RNA polymerase sigma-70 factor, ECF subfamily